MNLLSLTAVLGVGFVAGFGLHAWAPWADVDQHERKAAVLVGLDYGEIKHDQGFAAASKSFLDGLDGNCPQGPAERVIAIVMAQDRYGMPPLAGYQIASYADRFGDALGLLTAYRLREAPALQQERYQRAREVLNHLNHREGEYCAYVFGGTGAHRDRRVQHMEVEEFMSGWALRLAKSTAGTNADPRKSFGALVSRLESDHQTLEKIFKDDVLREYRLEEGARCRREIMEAFARLMEELKAWPPEVSDGLAPLILQTFQ